MKYITIIMIYTLTSCNLSLDRKNRIDIGKELVKSFSKNDTTALKDLFYLRMDSMEIESKESIFKTMSAFEGKGAKFLKVDTSSYSLSFDENEGDLHHILYTYFRIDTNYYRLNSDYTIDSKGDIYLKYIYFVDMSKECNKWAINKYCPKHLIDFKRISWQAYYSNRMFRSARIELVNKSEHELDFIKVKVVLKNNGETFFNQTVISNQKIFAGDFFTIEIPGLSDYFTGFEINKNNIQFDAELIEVLPKPESSDCKEIAQLKLLK